MKLAYICSPSRASDYFEMDRNVEYAQKLTKCVAQIHKDAPITPHLYIPQCLSKSGTAKTELINEIDKAILSKCDYIFVGCEYGITDEMKAIIDFGTQNNMEIICMG